MDATGIQTAILSIASMHGVWFEADPKSVPALARTCNDYVAKVMRDHPPLRGRSFATLPMPNVEASLKEVAYAFRHAARRRHRHPDELGRPLAGRCGVRFALGRTEPPQSDGRVSSLRAQLLRGCSSPALTNPTWSILRTARTFLSLLFSGTLAKYRDVRWTLCHGGGALPFLAGRINSLAVNSREKLDVIAPNGIDYELKRMYFDTANATYAPTMAAMIKYIPVSQMMFGTDYPTSPASRTWPARSDGLSPTTSPQSNAATPCA